MNNVTSNTAFIISDLFLLVNLILIIKSVNWAEFKSDLIKLFSVSVIHGFYTLIFSSYFATSSKLMMSVLLAVYYLRFLFFPFIFTKKIKFISIYMPLFLNHQTLYFKASLYGYSSLHPRLQMNPQ